MKVRSRIKRMNNDQDKQGWSEIYQYQLGDFYKKADRHS